HSALSKSHAAAPALFHYAVTSARNFRKCGLGHEMALKALWTVACMLRKLWADLSAAPCALVVGRTRAFSPTPRNELLRRACWRRKTDSNLGPPLEAGLSDLRR